MSRSVASMSGHFRPNGLRSGITENSTGSATTKPATATSTPTRARALTASSGDKGGRSAVSCASAERSGSLERKVSCPGSLQK